jgi:formyltetrahydrofolate deformylase
MLTDLSKQDAPVGQRSSGVAIKSPEHSGAVTRQPRVARNLGTLVAQVSGRSVAPQGDPLDYPVLLAKVAHEGVLGGFEESSRASHGSLIGRAGVPDTSSFGYMGRMKPDDSDEPTARLRLSCPDQKGLVARVAEFVWKLGGNITHADQHTDEQAGVFFQRVEFLLQGLGVDRGELTEFFAALASGCGMNWRLSFSDERRRMAVLVSRQGHCLYDLLARWRAGELPCEVVAIVSNWPDHSDAANHFGVPFYELPVSDETRDAQETKLLRVLDDHRVELVVLARYMQVLSERVIDPYLYRVINIHHSFLPAFAGGRPYAQAHARGVKLIGATAHYATNQLDDGPIIDQDVTRISHRDSTQDMARKGRDLETTVLARAVRAHLTDRILVRGLKTVVFE